MIYETESSSTPGIQLIVWITRNSLEDGVQTVVLLGFISYA